MRKQVDARLFVDVSRIASFALHHRSLLTFDKNNLAGPSKAGKTFLLMYLAIAIAEGIDWLRFKCKKGRVLYINLEIDDSSAIHRMYAIYEALGIQPKNDGNIVLWNLRGHAEPMDQLVPTILHRLRNRHFNAIIIDPIYKPVGKTILTLSSKVLLIRTGSPTDSRR